MLLIRILRSSSRTVWLLGRLLIRIVHIKGNWSSRHGTILQAPASLWSHAPCPMQICMIYKFSLSASSSDPALYPLLGRQECEMIKVQVTSYLWNFVTVFANRIILWTHSPSISLFLPPPCPPLNISDVSILLIRGHNEDLK